MYCIDYQLFKGGRHCGLANRILFKAKYKDKITLRKSRSNRKPTEYQKLKDAIKNGGIYPEIFCVSCIVGDKVKSCAVVRTSDLMKFISETNPPTFYNYDRDKHQRQSAVILTNKQLNDSTNQNDSTKFLVHIANAATLWYNVFEGITL